MRYSTMSEPDRLAYPQHELRPLRPIQRVSVMLPGAGLLNDEVGKGGITALRYDHAAREVLITTRVGGKHYERVLNLRSCVWWQLWDALDTPVHKVFPPMDQPPLMIPGR